MHNQVYISLHNSNQRDLWFHQIPCACVIYSQMNLDITFILYRHEFLVLVSLSLAILKNNQPEAK